LGCVGAFGEDPVARRPRTRRSYRVTVPHCLADVFSEEIDPCRCSHDVRDRTAGGSRRNFQEYRFGSGVEEFNMERAVRDPEPTDDVTGRAKESVPAWALRKGVAAEPLSLKEIEATSHVTGSHREGDRMPHCDPVHVADGCVDPFFEEKILTVFRQYLFGSFEAFHLEDTDRSRPRGLLRCQRITEIPFRELVPSKPAYGR